jgi:predicted transcriptional regulator
VSSSQRRTLEVFLALRLLHRRAPTLMELARSLRVTRQAVHYRLHWLEKKGLWNGSGRTITEPGLRSALDALTR